jgi:hypothetical protein
MICKIDVVILLSHRHKPIDLIYVAWYVKNYLYCEY